jgi:glutamate synthase domain-containing protein 1
MPKIMQVFVGMGETFYNRTDFERRLYLVRQRAENVIEFNERMHPDAREDFYICSLSTSRIVYKGMLTADQVGPFYLDLQDPTFVSALAMVHSRFSTNTFPAWRLAHPYRMVAHNGEINTLRGNRNWMRARTGLPEVRGVRRRVEQDVPGHHRDRVRLGHARQRAAVPLRERPEPAALDPDDGPRGVAEERPDGPGP